MVVETEDCLEAMGRAVSVVSENAARVVFFRFLWLWDVGFWVFAGFALTRRLTQSMLVRFGSRGLLRLIAAHRPDIVVSTYPHATEVLGRLRRARRLQVPVCAVITDLAGLRYWATPGADLHLVTHPESIAEVKAIAGDDTEVHCVHGFSAPEFLEPRDPADARRALGLVPRAKIVLVSGGGWGVGDVEGAVREVLAVAGRRPGRVPLRPQRRAARAARAATSRTTRASGPSRSPTRCPTGSRPPTRSSTRPAA